MKYWLCVLTAYFLFYWDFFASCDAEGSLSGALIRNSTTAAYETSGDGVVENITEIPTLNNSRRLSLSRHRIRSAERKWRRRRPKFPSRNRNKSGVYFSVEVEVLHLSNLLDEAREEERREKERLKEIEMRRRVG